MVRDQVIRLRQAAGLTQRQLSSLSGVAQSNIAAYESGSRRPSEQMLERLMAAAVPRPSLPLARHRVEVLAAAGRHRAHDVRVFGSVARGDDRPGSDIDLLVTFDPHASLFDQVELAHELQELLGVGVDVVSEGGLHEGHEILRQARPL